MARERASLCKKQNLEGELKDKILAVAVVTQVVTYILSGKVDVGFINQTELNAHKDEFGSFILIDKALYVSKKRGSSLYPSALAMAWRGWYNAHFRQQYHRQNRYHLACYL